LLIPIFKQSAKESELSGINLVDHILKILEKIIDKRLREIVVDQNPMKFGFRPGRFRPTTDAIFLLRQFLQKNVGQKTLYRTFVDPTAAKTFPQHSGYRSSNVCHKWG